jgi:ATP-dependent RNA helicase DDX56/DBP9
VSRGVDFHGVAFVVNVYFLHNVPTYTHHIGRTARGGSNGTALSLISPEPKKESRMLIKFKCLKKHY